MIELSPVSYIDCKYQSAHFAWIETDIAIPERIDFGYITMYPSGRIETRAGFTWDGASGALDTENMIIPSKWHDVGCRLEENGLITKEVRHQFDDLLKTLLDQGTKKSKWGVVNKWNNLRGRYIHRAIYLYTERKAGKHENVRPIITVG